MNNLHINNLSIKISCLSIINNIRVNIAFMEFLKTVLIYCYQLYDKLADNYKRMTYYVPLHGYRTLALNSKIAVF